MTTLVTVLTALLGWLSPGADARAAQQGGRCDARHACAAGLECIPRGEGTSSCERLCHANAKCPADQRCVKNGEHHICRPITDGLGL